MSCTIGLVLAIAATAALLVALVPVRLVIAARVRGASDGSWAASGGAELPGITAGIAKARGTSTIVDVRLFGRRIALDRRPRREGERSWLASLEGAWTRFSRWLDPIDVLAFLLTETRRLSLRDVDGSVRLALRDVVLAGHTAGALSMASALVAPFGRLSHTVEFGVEDRLDATLSFAVRFRPAMLAADAASFLVRSIRLRDADIPVGVRKRPLD